MIYIECPNTLEPWGKVATFLAGGIQNCSDWQSVLSEKIKNIDLVVYNPRRKNFPIHDPKAAEAQIMWEFSHFKKITFNTFWFPRETLCPIVLMELGKQMMVNKPMVVGVDPQYQRKQDVEIQLKLARPEVEIVYSLDDLAQQIKTQFNFFS